MTGDDSDGIGRRSVLQAIGTGAVLSGLGGQTIAGNHHDGGGSGNPPDRHIIGTTGGGATASAKSVATTVHREMDFGEIGRAVAGRYSDAALENLESRPDVRYIEPEGQVQAIGQSLPWGVDRVDAELAHDDGAVGSGADIAILDTGIDSDHPDLETNLGEGKAFFDCDEFEHTNECHEDWDDDNDHGTHCAGIAGAVDNDEAVVGVSTQPTLHAVKVLRYNGYGEFSDVAAAIEYVANQGWDVASMSFASTQESLAINDALEYASSKGVLLVAAAGNSGPCTDCVLYPASKSPVVAVSSTNSSDELSDFSSQGAEVEIAAPGSSVPSTVPGGTATFSGTSMACPHVSGAGGLLMANGDSASQARGRLVETAEDIGLDADEQGDGLLDVEAAAPADSDTLPAMQTHQPTDIGHEQATLNGELETMGGAEAAGCYFRFWKVGDENATARFVGLSNLGDPGQFSTVVSGLSGDTTYAYAARAEATDYDWNDSDPVQFTTDAVSNLTVATAPPSAVGSNDATLEGSLDDLGGAGSADCSFEYRKSNESTWQPTATETLSSSGSFSRTVSGLDASTDYEFRAVADASDGDTDTGTTRTFTTTDTSLTVSTSAASGIGSSKATLEGSLDDLGGASSADCSFEYRESGSNSWQQTAAETLSATSSFSRSVSGLNASTEYEFRAVADASDGDVATGSIHTFTTGDTSLGVSTSGASAISSSGVTLEGSLDDLGGASSADCSFEYRKSGSNSWQQTAAETLSATGSFSQSVNSLKPSTEYEYRAVADANDGDVATGSNQTFTTEADSSGETVVDVTTDEPFVVWTGPELKGTLTELEGADSASVYFTYWKEGQKADSKQVTSKQTMTSTGSFKQTVDVASHTDYVYRAVAIAPDGTKATGDKVYFQSY